MRSEECKAGLEPTNLRAHQINVDSYFSFSNFERTLGSSLREEIVCVDCSDGNPASSGSHNAVKRNNAAKETIDKPRITHSFLSFYARISIAEGYVR